MIRLDSTTKKLQVVLSGNVTTNQLPCVVSYFDKSSSGITGGSQETNTNNTTETDICTAPAASTVRDIDYLSVRNRDTVAATITIIKDVSGANYELFKVTLGVDDVLEYTHGNGWKVTLVSI